MIKKCEYCNKEFTTAKGHCNQRFCCKSCSVRARFPEDIGLFSNCYHNNIVCYIIGLILTDGCITKNGASDIIVVSLKDKYMIEMIRDYVCPQKKIYRDGNNYQVKWRNKTDVELLKSMYITERKSFTTKFINFEYDMWHFIRGVFDGDGCVYYDNIKDKKYGRFYSYKRVSITTGSYSFAMQLNIFLNNNNIHSTISKDSRKRECYYVKIFRQDSVMLFAKKIYNESFDWRLKRKYDIFYNLQ